MIPGAFFLIFIECLRYDWGCWNPLEHSAAAEPNWPAWPRLTSGPPLSAASHPGLWRFLWNSSRSGCPPSSASGIWDRRMRWAERKGENVGIWKGTPRCDRFLTGQSDRYVKVDLCVVVGLHRPHGFKSGLKEKKGGSVFHTHTHTHTSLDVTEDTHVISVSFRRQRQSVCSRRGSLHPLETNTHTHTAVKTDAAAGEESECVFPGPLRTLTESCCHQCRACLTLPAV